MSSSMQVSFQFFQEFPGKGIDELFGNCAVLEKLLNCLLQQFHDFILQSARHDNSEFSMLTHQGSSPGFPYTR